jgi:hypothetical protein
MDTLSGIRYGPQIAAAARANGLDPQLLAAVAAQETGGPGSNSGANIVGDGGHGHGLFQLDDRYHAIAGTPAAMDPATNADYAGKLLSGLLQRYGGDLHAALSAYNAGSPQATGTVTTWPDGSRLGYADSVMRHLASIQSGDASASTQSVATSFAPAVATSLAPAVATSPSSIAAGMPMFMPQAPQVPAFTPNNQPYRSFSSEYHDGGGAVADQDDKKMADALDPSDGTTTS